MYNRVAMVVSRLVAQ